MIDWGRSFLAPLADHLRDHGIGSAAEIFDGDPPFVPQGCIAQAWSVADASSVARAYPRLRRASGDQPPARSGVRRRSYRTPR